MKPSVRLALLDIRDVADEAIAYLDGQDFAACRQSGMAKRAIERCIEVISEATRRIPDDMRARYSRIPWPEVMAIGNKLRHEYQRVDDLVLWWRRYRCRNCV